MESLLWERVGELADRAPRISDLQHHKLQVVAATRMRQRGDEVPAELRHAEQLAAAMALGTEPLLRRIRAATDAPIILMKGPVAAARWPKPRLRPWKDLDLFVEDADAVQAALLSAGFVEVGDVDDYAQNHHLRPMGCPGLPLSVEVHRRPKWPNESPPSFREVADAAVPAGFAVPGVFAPSLEHHAVLMAGHAWEHDPLSSVGLLADIAATRLGAGPESVAAIAKDWGVAELWSTTERAIERLLLSRRRPWRRPIWQRHLYEARERTVLEGHVERLVSPISAAPIATAPTAAARAVMTTLRPWPGERWGAKLARSRRSLTHASMRESEHDTVLFGRTTDLLGRRTGPSRSAQRDT